MQELLNSFVRFSAAITLFSMQQLQNAVGAAVDTQSAINKFRDALDSVTNAITSQIDESQKKTLNSMTNLGSDLVGRTWDAFNVPALDPREMVETGTNLMRRTTDSLTDLMKRATAAGAKGSGEPQPAADALGGR